MRSHAEDASSLLRIDFVAALDKVAWAQLQGTWQLPAELARLAIACGARGVDLEISPRRLALTAPGARVEHRTVTDFATLLDRGLDAAERHRAMVELEERDAFVLSAVAGLSLRSLTLRTGGEEGLKLELRRGGDLRIRNPGASAVGRPDLELVLDGLSIDAGRAAKWLRRVCRFAAVPIAIDGLPIDRGFDAPLIEQRLQLAPRGPQPGAPQPGAPQPGALLPIALAIPHHGQTPRLWLLRHGIIATRATVPGYPAFEAAVEMAAADDPGAVAGGRTTGAALREQLAHDRKL